MQFWENVTLHFCCKFASVFHFDLVLCDDRVDANFYAQKLQQLYDAFKVCYPALVIQKHTQSCIMTMLQHEHCKCDLMHTWRIWEDGCITDSYIQPRSCAIRWPTFPSKTYILKGRNFNVVDEFENKHGVGFTSKPAKREKHGLLKR